MPCILQSWNTLRREFEDYVEFGLSEHVTTSGTIPHQEEEDDDEDDLVIAQTWRVLILHPRDRGDLCDIVYELE